LPNLPAFKGCSTFACDFARKIAARAISLPSSVGLSEEDQAVVAESLFRTLEEN
jgi:dTDP-4-amino-4,6-dideoxygalactose transaminase